MVPTVSLSFLNRRTVRQVCRVCHEIAELKTERLCAVCVRIKAQIRSRFPDAVRGTTPPRVHGPAKAPELAPSSNTE